MKKAIIALILLLTVCVLFGCLFERVTLITTQSHPDNGYSISLYQIGSPQWSFGGVTAKLVLKNPKGKTVEQKTFELANDGAGVFKSNLNAVTWLSDRVEIKISEADTSNIYTYTFYYE